MPAATKFPAALRASGARGQIPFYSGSEDALVWEHPFFFPANRSLSSGFRTRQGETISKERARSLRRESAGRVVGPVAFIIEISGGGV